jgi:hypothetical protein
MKRCDNCGGRFGLIRHRHYTLRFCEEKCLEAWKRARLERARQQRFHEWLRQPEVSLLSVSAHADDAGSKRELS